MAISIFDLFTIGIGPSSSHTVGPMRAARRFVDELSACNHLEFTASVRSELFGSLGLTGRGHGSDKAVILGLAGETPEGIDPDSIETRVAEARSTGRIFLLGTRPVRFVEAEHLILNRRRSLPFHPNGMEFTAFDAQGATLLTRVYYSVGGGFVVGEEAARVDHLEGADIRLPYPITSGRTMLELGRTHGLSLAEMTRRNELTWRTEAQVDEALQRIWEAMQHCVERGCTRSDPLLPGKLRVRRRAPGHFRELSGRAPGTSDDPLSLLDWVNLWALAVNEENATGGRVVTAPTNGAAGIIPAVLHYYWRCTPHATIDGVRRFLLAAGAIGIIYKLNASISGAEVGCQGEVGVACSMAAGALTEVLGGTIEQVEEAAEIGMEHNLGLTCDPVGGLVQIPCIERNAMGAVKAINASRMALRNDGTHRVSLDHVIVTMRQTGRDMKKKYKESSQGGLAVNVTEC